MIKQYDKYTYFWSGPFSQWAKSPFFLDGLMFVTAEQYMMYKKAMTFGNLDIARQVLDTDNPREQKALGRQVRNFSIDIWAAVARDVVFRGNVAKFTQNSGFYHDLIETSGTMLVEASPMDRVWGIGLDEAAAKLVTPDKWRGSNWLGQCITEVRETIEAGFGSALAS